MCRNVCGKAAGEFGSWTFLLWLRVGGEAINTLAGQCNRTLFQVSRFCRFRSFLFFFWFCRGAEPDGRCMPTPYT